MDNSDIGNVPQVKTRAFIAIELPEEVKRLIAAHIECLNSLIPGKLKWVDPRIAHLTLAFLGNVSDVRLSTLFDIVDQIGLASPSFSLQTGTLGAFPNYRRTRVLWLGLEGETPFLSELQSSLGEALSNEGFSVEKRAFKPHVTLGRARGKGLVPVKEEDLNLLPYEGLEFEVRELALMSSVLTPRGPIHTPLHISPLSGTANTCPPGVP